MILFIFNFILCINAFGYKSKQDVKQQIELCLGQGGPRKIILRVLKHTPWKVPVTTCQAKCISAKEKHDEIVANKMNMTEATKKYDYIFVTRVIMENYDEN